MSFCQICREELPGHQMGCPVLTGEPVRGVHQAAYSREHKVLVDVICTTLEHAYEVLGALQDVCHPDDLEFLRARLSQFRELIDSIDERLP